MDDEERARYHRITGAGCDLRYTLVGLGRSMELFTSRYLSTRPDECERFLAEHRAARALAELAAQAIEDEVREANRGATSDGPDKWTADLDRINHERLKGK
jgi:hypothetical protein